MRYRVIVGDRNTVRGVVELEANNRQVTKEGTLILYADAEGMNAIVTYAAGAWRSITDVELFKAAFKAGQSDENPGRREAARSVQAV